ncbi:MAG: peptidase M48 family protein, partial [Micavibrio aeruginosavorus]
GAQINPTGIVTFLTKLSSEELLPTSQQSQFMRSHPLSRDRIDILRSKVETSPLDKKPLPAEWSDQYQRTKAKLMGFVTPQQVTYTYKSTDNGIPSLYARAISAYRMSHLKEALILTDQLLAKEPSNPYFLELKGQMLYEFGRARDSLSPYEKALAAKPSAGLIRIAYAQSLIDTAGKSPAMLDKAIEQLKRAQLDEPRTSRVKRLLATAYGKKGDETRARVYLAEEALMQGRKSQAVSMAKSAMAGLPKNSPEYLRAQDVVASVDGL